MYYINREYPDNFYFCEPPLKFINVKHWFSGIKTLNIQTHKLALQFCENWYHNIKEIKITDLLLNYLCALHKFPIKNKIETINLILYAKNDNVNLYTIHLLKKKNS